MQKAKIALLILIYTALTGLPCAARVRTEPASFRRGVDLFERGHWADARHELLRARAMTDRNDPQSREQIDYYLAVCAVELGRPDAEVALLNYETDYPESFRTNDVRFARASYYCTTGNHEKALRAFDSIDYRALDAANRQKFDIRRGYLAFAADRYDEAYGYFERVDPQGEYGDHALYYKSYIDYSRGDYPKAKAGFEQLTRSDAYRAVAPFYLLQLEFRQRNFRYVAENGDALIRIASAGRKCDLQRMVAEARFHLEEYDKALAYIRDYRQSGGETGRDDSYIEGFSLYRLARYDAAAEALRRACGADDALTQNAAYHLADCYLRSGRKQEAMQAFAMATDRHLNDEIAEEALFNYGKLQYELGGGRFNEAIHVLGRYVKSYPQSPRLGEARTLLAAAYYNSEDYDAAYEAIKALPNPDGEMRAALQKVTYFRALKRCEQGDLEGAQRSLRESAAIGITPRYTALADFWQGEIAYAKGLYDTAAQHYDRFLARAPRTEREYALAYYNLGYCRFQREQTARADEAFVQFLELYPAADDYRADALNRLGDVRYAARRFDEALASYEAAIATGLGARYYAQYQRAAVLGILGQTDRKIEALRAIVAADRGDYASQAAYELGRTYVSRGQYREGAQVLERFTERYPHSPRYTAALSDLGLIYANLGDKKRSLDCYDRVVKTAPTSAEARGAMQGIREIYMADGNAEGYFAYAERNGSGGDLSARTRDSLSFAAAQSLYLADRTEDAARSLRSYVKSFPQGAYLTDALYCLSDCYRTSKQADPELETLEKLVAQGRNQYTVGALERLAELAWERKRYAAAADAGRQLSECAATARARSSALEGYVRAAAATGDEKTISEAADFVERHSDASPKALREVRFARAKLLEKHGDRKAALALYDRLRSEVRSAEGAEAMYRVIEAHAADGNDKEAEELIFAFADMPSPRSYWLAKSYILLGDIYLRRGDAFQARATYQSVADGYSPADDGIVAEAKERIAKLKN